MSLYPEEIAALEFFGVSENQAFGKSREKQIVKARHLIWYLLRENKKMTLNAIGARYNRDHASVSNALKKNIKSIVPQEYQASPTLIRSPPHGRPVLTLSKGPFYRVVPYQYPA